MLGTFYSTFYPVAQQITRFLENSGGVDIRMQFPLSLSADGLFIPGTVYAGRPGTVGNAWLPNPGVGQVSHPPQSYGTMPGAPMPPSFALGSSSRDNVHGLLRPAPNSVVPNSPTRTVFGLFGEQLPECHASLSSDAPVDTDATQGSPHSTLAGRPDDSSQASKTTMRGWGLF